MSYLGCFVALCRAKVLVIQPYFVQLSMPGISTEHVLGVSVHDPFFTVYSFDRQVYVKVILSGDKV